MTIYRVQGPDGRVYRIEGPDTATEDEVLAFAAERYAVAVPAEELAPIRNPGPSTRGGRRRPQQPATGPSVFDNPNAGFPARRQPQKLFQRDPERTAGGDFQSIARIAERQQAGRSVPQPAAGPVSREFRGAVGRGYDMGGESRAQLLARDDRVGVHAREIDARHAAADAADQSLLPRARVLTMHQRLGTRVEDREARLLSEGLAPDAAAGLARRGVELGIVPGREVTGSVTASNEDWMFAGERDAADTAKDVAGKLVSGVIAIPQMVVGGIDLAATPLRALLEKATGEYAPTLTEGLAALGMDMAGARKILSTEWRSDAGRASDARADEAFAAGLGDGLRHLLVQDPARILEMSAEAAPQMLTLAAGARYAAGRVFSDGVAKAQAAGVFGDGAVVASRAAVEQALPRLRALSAGLEGLQSAASQAADAAAAGGLDGRQALAATGAGLATAVIGAYANKVGGKLGLEDVETAAATAGMRSRSGGGLIASAAKGALRESVLEEMPQSASEAAFQNLGDGRPLASGVGRAAVEGGIVGAVMGGAVGAAAAPRAVASARAQDAQNAAVAKWQAFGNTLQAIAAPESAPAAVTSFTPPSSLIAREGITPVVVPVAAPASAPPMPERPLVPRHPAAFASDSDLLERVAATAPQAAPQAPAAGRGERSAPGHGRGRARVQRGVPRDHVRL